MLYVFYRLNNDVIYFSATSDGTTWYAGGHLPGVDKSEYDPVVVSDEDGITVFFTSADEGDYYEHLVYYRYNGSEWGPLEAVDFSSGYLRLQIPSDAVIWQGNLWLTYKEVTAPSVPPIYWQRLGILESDGTWIGHDIGPRNGDGSIDCPRLIWDVREELRPSDTESFTLAVHQENLYFGGNDYEGLARRADGYQLGLCKAPCNASTDWSRLVDQGGNANRPYSKAKLFSIDDKLILAYQECNRYGLNCSYLHARYKVGE
jgi:hypothetical protein